MITPRLFARLNDKQARLDALRPLPPAAVRRLESQLAVEWTYNSNAIEGSTLSLRETQLILETGLTIGGKTLREHFEVINHRAAIAYVGALAHGDQPITLFHVRQIHKLVLTNIDDDEAGQYRSVPVRIAGTQHIPPDAWDIPRLMDDWGTWLHKESGELHPIEQAALAHHRLAAIHPFVDGNGRTARLVMNLILLQQGFPPTIILQVNRQQYYKVLAQADRGKPEPLVNFVARAVERSLNLYLEAVQGMRQPPAEDETWLPLREASIGTPYSQEYLSLLARTGRLDAIKRGRAWYTTRQAVSNYRESVEGQQRSDENT